MASSEGDRRHNPTRTEIPNTFIDLGKLFDEDSRREYMDFPKTRRVPNSHIATAGLGEEYLQSELQDGNDEDFMIG